MKRFLLLLLALVLLCVGCEGVQQPTETTETTQTASFDLSSVPENFIAMWRSADAGELDMVETITFFEDGTLSVNCTYQGADVGTIYGTYYVDGDRVCCDMTANGEPYTVEYHFVLDGRELTLEDDDGPAHYLRVS